MMAGQPKRRAKRNAYSADLGRRICDKVAEGKGLGTIEAMPDMPARRTVRGWLEAHPEFEASYERARRWRADTLVDEAIELTDSVIGSDNNAAVTAARNAADLRKWLASKLLPERFGDRTVIVGAGGGPLETITKIELIAVEPMPWDERSAGRNLHPLHPGGTILSGAAAAADGPLPLPEPRFEPAPRLNPSQRQAQQSVHRLPVSYIRSR